MKRTPTPFTEAEFGFNLEDKEAASSIFIKKKPLGMEVTPEIATYRTKYREQDGKWYFAYSRAEVKFKVNWKKKTLQYLLYNNVGNSSY